MTTTHYCPECGSDKVFSSHLQGFMVNTGDHYCHLVKVHDPESYAGCIECQWRGTFADLKPVLPDATTRALKDKT
jgi:hypothetical protein